MFISFLGEAIGAAIAFLLYRKGFKKTVEKKLDKYPKVKRLLDAEDKEAFYLVLALRLIPFVPSGLITFAAAVGRNRLLLTHNAFSWWGIICFLGGRIHRSQ